MTLRLWRLLQGYVIIKVKGPMLERFLNRLARADIPVWDVQRLTGGMLVASVSLSGFHRVRALCRAQGWKVAIVDRAGFPFIWAALGRRKMLVVGAMAAMVAVYVASGFVWFVQVDADEGVPTERIISVAAAAGLRPGTARERVDRHQIQRALLLEIDELSWATVHLQGALAVIEAVRRSGIDERTVRPGDVIAARDGVIEKVVALAGQAVVAEGETVKAGDLLISGFILPSSPEHARRIEAGEPPYVRADGVVTARVWYEGKATIPLVETVDQPTGNESWGLTVRLGEWSWALGRSSPPYDAYQEESSSWQRRIGPVLVGWERVSYQEVLRSYRTLSRAEGESLGRAAAWEHLQAQLQGRAPGLADPQFSAEVIMYDGGPAVQVTARIESIESIVSFREFEF